MIDWSILEWLQAGQTPIMLVVAVLLWRLERRVFIIELEVFPHKRKGEKHVP